MASETSTPPQFLVDLLNAHSPSGYESEAQAVIDRYMEPIAHRYERDTMGNRMASIHPDGSPTVLLAGHIDELGLIVRYVDDKGFVYFENIGGQDRTMISGRRVCILSKNGIVKGVTGKRAIHLMSAEDRKKVPEVHEMWIDIGAKTRKEAFERIQIGDSATCDEGFEVIQGNLAVARAFDDKSGAYVVNEVLRRVAKFKSFHANLVALSSVQEEVGTRGAIAAAYNVNPQFAIAVDVNHATDHPDCDNRKHGQIRLGGGPIITRGSNINPIVFEKLVRCAQEADLPHQIEAEAYATGTDGRVIQITRRGVPTGVVSIPLRYMHTPSEVVDLSDIENCVRLLVAFTSSLEADETAIW